MLACPSAFSAQHLRITQFFGTSVNSVKSQFWMTVAVYILVAIGRKRLNLGVFLHAMLQMLSKTPLESVPLFRSLPKWEPMISPQDPNKMALF